jgi:hypothetical protein
MHPRTAIRKAIRAVLATPETPVDGEGQALAPVYPTPAGANVFDTRTAPITPRVMPAALVYVQADRIDGDAPYQQPGGPLRRILTVAVEAAAAGEDADDDVDALCERIEAALDASMNLGGLCETIQLQGTTLEPVGDGAQFFMVALMEFEVVYWTAAEDEDGVVPTKVYGSWAPDIGTPNEPLYRELSADLPPPPIGGLDCT